MPNPRKRKVDSNKEILTAILNRISALENSVSVSGNPAPSTSRDAATGTRALAIEAGSPPAVPAHVDPEAGEGSSLGTEVSPDRRHGSSCNESSTCTEDTTARIFETLASSLTKVRSIHYYISPFDPNIHNIDAWCEEVDRARNLHNWDDNETLSRIGNCLKGDARLWLNEWITNDRSWSNFKREFKALCPPGIDIANILFEVMSTDSKSFATYAEYARRSLLRLGLVRGLSDELIVAIIIRGITDPQIRAAATNAKLSPHDLVSFLSTYTKPKTSFQLTHNQFRSSNNINSDTSKQKHYNTELKCFLCGKSGHKQVMCSKRRRYDNSTSTSNPNESTNQRPVLYCTFCKKNGHKFENSFSSQSNKDNTRNVNLCRKLDNISSKNDVMTAVIQGIPVDVLIDSGSCVSLISEALLKHFTAHRNVAYRTLRGIGSQLIESTCYVTLVMEFSQISLEVDLYVVPADCLNTSIIIGTDVLNREGVTYVRRCGKQFLMRDDKVYSYHIRENLDNINSTLQGEDRRKLLSIISDFSQFLISGTATTTVTTGSMEILLTKDSKPIHYRPYRLSYDEKLRIRKIVQDLLAKGIVRESVSAFASPVFLVKKKDGSDRMCVDYRALNSITVKERFPLPLIEDHIDRLGSSKFFTSLDMASGFHQVPLRPDSVDKTAFVTNEGQYEYVKMPYGLANAPVVYQRIITKTLKKFIESGHALVYIDDVLLLSMTVAEGLELLRAVLDTLTSAGFSINLKKCTFLSEEIEYLGRTISNGQVRPSIHKVQALVNSKIPTNVREVRQFLGLAGYFRRYIPNYSVKTACIARLTKKDTLFLWGNEQSEARKYLIQHLTNAPVLAIFNPELPSELHTDASAVGYGAVLLQIHNNNQKRVVDYFSKSTQGAEAKYHSYELETLAIVKSLQHFRHYLLGVTFKIVTDCNALKLTERKKDLLPRVARWWIYMQDFRFTIEYRKGALIPHADHLSRNPVDVYHHISQIKNPKNWAQIAQSADEETFKLIDQVTNGQLDSSRYVVRNGLLYYKYNLTGEEPRFLCYIPKGYRLSLLHLFHDDHDHIGFDKTVELILHHFWFPGLHAFAKKYIKHCVTCLSHKRVPRAPEQPIKSWSKPDEPFHTLHMDVLGPLPESQSYKFILITVDSFSKYCLLHPIYRQDTDELKRVFTNVISLFGTPNLLITDRGRMFESSAFQSWVHSLGTETHFITPGMHHENGQVERYCRTVLNMLRIEVNNRGSSWLDVLWRIQLIINITKHSTTQTSALQLLVGINATTPVIRALVRDVSLDFSEPNREGLLSLRRQRATSLLTANQQKQDSYVNDKRKEPRVFKINDFVFVIKSSQATGKLDSCMRGPYRVTGVLPHNRYKLELLAGSYGKHTEAAAQYLVSWKGEWTPETCAVFFESDDPSSNDQTPTEGTRQEDTLAAVNTQQGPEQEAVGDEPQSGEAV